MQKVVSKAMLPPNTRSCLSVKGARKTELWSCQDLANGQVVTIGCGRRVIDYDSRTTRGSGTVLHLNPVCIADRCEVLMDEALSGSRRSCYFVIKVVANSEHPGVVSGCHKTRALPPPLCRSPPP